MGDFPVICDNGASSHMFYSSNCMINYREANATMRAASDKIYPIEGYGDLPLTFQSSRGERDLCCFTTSDMYLASATIVFL